MSAAKPAANDEAETVRCGKCQTEIGVYAVGPDGRVWLRIGGLLLRHGHGRCACCGVEFHWAFTDKILERLLEHRSLPDVFPP